MRFVPCFPSPLSRDLCQFCTWLLASQGKSSLTIQRPSVPRLLFPAPPGCWEYSRCLNMLPVIPSLLHSSFLTNPVVLWCCLWVLHSWSQHPGALLSHTLQPGHCSAASLWASRRFKCLLLCTDSIITPPFSICSFQIFYHQGVSWIN